MVINTYEGKVQVKLKQKSENWVGLLNLPQSHWKGLVFLRDTS